MHSEPEILSCLTSFESAHMKTKAARMGHYHADGDGELICKDVLSFLKDHGTSYSWNSADTPELNSTSEPRSRTLGERTICLSIWSGLPSLSGGMHMKLQIILKEDFPLELLRPICRHMNFLRASLQIYHILESEAVKRLLEYLVIISEKISLRKLTMVTWWDTQIVVKLAIKFGYRV